VTRLQLDALRGLRLIADTGELRAARRARRALRLVDSEVAETEAPLVATDYGLTEADRKRKGERR
jgi:hypothetical protein